LFTYMPLESLESLCLDAVADNLHLYEPYALHLPCGGGLHIIDRLGQRGRLRPETLAPLLASDWTSADELQERLGSALATGAASGSRGLSMLATQRLRFRLSAEKRKAAALPAGTREVTSSSAAALAAR
jgi:hypothetical protein